MSIACQLVSPDSLKSVWDEITLAKGDGTFFHTPHWSAILTTVFPSWQSAPLALEFSDGNYVMIPFLKRRILLGDFWYAESLVPGVYGGPTFLETPSIEHWNLTWQEVAKMRDFVLIENPFLHEHVTPRFEERQLFTQVLDIQSGFESVRRNFSKGHRANIKAAHNAQIEIMLAHSTEDITAYYQVYKNSLSRWGKNAAGFYPLKLFLHLFSDSDYGKSIRLWVAREKNQIVAGGWFFYHHAQVTYWHSAVLAHAMRKFPMHLLISAVIQDACQQNMRWFDFCPSGGLSGVERFKSGFGSHKINFSAYRKLSPLGRAFRISRYLAEHYLHTSSLL